MPTSIPEGIARMAAGFLAWFGAWVGLGVWCVSRGFGDVFGVRNSLLPILFPPTKISRDGTGDCENARNHISESDEVSCDRTRVVEIEKTADGDSSQGTSNGYPASGIPSTTGHGHFSNVISDLELAMLVGPREGGRR
jgi:hypothetical protein